jgi:hypothetical protein
MMGAAASSVIAYTVRAAYLYYASHRLHPNPFRFRPAIALFAFTGMVMWVGQSVTLGNLWLGALVKLALLGTFLPALLFFRIVGYEQVVRVVKPRFVVG